MSLWSRRQMMHSCSIWNMRAFESITHKRSPIEVGMIYRARCFSLRAQPCDNLSKWIKDRSFHTAHWTSRHAFFYNISETSWPKRICTQTHTHSGGGRCKTWSHCTPSQTCSSFYGAAQGREGGGGMGWADALPWQCWPLKSGCNPRPGPDLRVFSACYSRFIFTIKKNNNLQKPLEARGRMGRFEHLLRPVPVLPKGLKQISQLVTHSAHYIKMHIEMI